jgi:hypothetical protein
MRVRTPTKENMNSGKHVEQAYSYAIHPDIRVPVYGLCNGGKLVVFHISQEEPVRPPGYPFVDAAEPLRHRAEDAR